MTRPLEPRGVLDPAAAEQRFDLLLQPPQDDLTEVVEHYWRVGWDMRGLPAHEQHTLPHPSVHVVVEPERASVVGVTPGRFTRTLEGEGWAFGIKFRPAGFRALLDAPLRTLTRRSVPVAHVFGRDGDDYVERVREGREAPEMSDAAAHFLRRRGAHADDTALLLNQLVADVVADRSITRVADLVDRFGVAERRLQRLFSEYVGIGPKWVIQRYRVIEAAERLSAGEALDLAALAQDLGYFDQAHFIRDFRSIVGRPPADYARSVHRARA